jgi:hypothetical protein
LHLFVWRQPATCLIKSETPRERNGMSGIYDDAEVLCSLLVLGGATSFPDHSGILDRALHATVGESYKHLNLSFSTGSVGFRCFELPEIIMASQETGMIEWRIGDMRYCVLKISVEEAREIAIMVDTISSFEVLGQRLVDALNSHSVTSPV